MEHTITIDTIPVFYRQEGPDNGKTIVILHGWGASSDSWRAVQHGLAKQQFRVIVPDLPGFGRTPEPASVWGVRDYSKFVRDFAEKLQLRSFALLGHSFGGRIAISYAHVHGKELEALILCDAAGISRRNKIRIWLFFILTKAGNLIFAMPILRFLKPYVRYFYYKITREKDYYQSDGRMREIFKRVVEEKIRHHISHITAPTLILWGEKDRATPVSDAHIIQKTIPQSHLYIFTGKGHAINLESPYEVTRQIALFLAPQT